MLVFTFKGIILVKNKNFMIIPILKNTVLYSGIVLLGSCADLGKSLQAMGNSMQQAGNNMNRTAAATPTALSTPTTVPSTLPTTPDSFNTSNAAAMGNFIAQNPEMGGMMLDQAIAQQREEITRLQKKNAEDKMALIKSVSPTQEEWDNMTPQEQADMQQRQIAVKMLMNMNSQSQQIDEQSRQIKNENFNRWHEATFSK
ncbi:hypothetical protein [Akkermansia muciniphila]|nr:hypothetical protein [Akkermansia muciniphila]